jgi:putative phosphoesterase
MTRIGVISDTHGNLDMMRSAAYALRDAHETTRIIHLGDYYRDGALLRGDGFQVWLVPGTMCPAYGGDERILREEIEGVSLVCAHTPDDLAAALATGGAALAMHGHTHAPYVELRGGTLWLNPGHLKSRLDRGHAPSYAVVDIEPGLIKATILGLDGDIRASECCRVSMENAHG